MKMLSILVGSLLIFGCAVGSFPAFPEIKDHYMVEVRNEPIPLALLSRIENVVDVPPMKEMEVVRCMHFEVTSKIPYKIKFLKQEPMKECHLVGGYKPKNSQSLYN